MLVNKLPHRENFKQRKITYLYKFSSSLNIYFICYYEATQHKVLQISENGLAIWRVGSGH